MGRLKARKNTDALHPLALHIGGLILKQRNRLMVTLRQASLGAGISSAFLCDIENGKRMPGALTLWKLSKYFDVPVSYWFRGYRID